MQAEANLVASRLEVLMTVAHDDPALLLSEPAAQVALAPSARHGAPFKFCSRWPLLKALTARRDKGVD